MLIDYQPLILSFIIRVARPKLPDLKKALVEAAGRIEDDDRSYVYKPDDYTVLLRRGYAISKIANFQPIPLLRLDNALKQTIEILKREDPDSIKYMFLLLDQYHADEEYHIQKGLALDLKEDTNCTFVLCNLENCDALESLCSVHPRCKYLKVNDMALLGKQLIEIYYPEEDRHTIDEEFIAKYGKSPKEAREELKEKYAENISNPTSTETRGGVESNES